MSQVDKLLQAISQRSAQYVRFQDDYAAAVVCASDIQSLFESMVKLATGIGFPFVSYSRIELADHHIEMTASMCNFDETGKYPALIAQRLSAEWEFRVGNRYINGWTKSVRAEDGSIGIVSIGRDEPITEATRHEMNELFAWFACAMHADISNELADLRVAR